MSTLFSRITVFMISYKTDSDTLHHVLAARMLSTLSLFVVARRLSFSAAAKFSSLNTWSLMFPRLMSTLCLAPCTAVSRHLAATCRSDLQLILPHSARSSSTGQTWLDFCARERGTPTLTILSLAALN